MASTILYKFRSGTTFEALPLPGTAARLFDVKRAIVKAKKLDSNTALEFDLSLRDASTDQEYTDESMLLPRGTRVVVQRLPAARGHGFLSRMARAEAGVVATKTAPTTAAAAQVPSNYYTIESRDREEEDEFVPTGAVPPPPPPPPTGGPPPPPPSQPEDKELAALMAVTDPGTATTMPGGFRPTFSQQQQQHRPAGSGPPPSQQRHFASSSSSATKPPTTHHRPNADPELRDQQLLPKKRATGIPRTFLNLSAPPVTDGSKGGEEEASAVARLQPNAIGFEELVHRGGGQSENVAGTKRDLDYALKLTATSIPEHLQCGICGGVVKDAMLLPWDVEGRTACEKCIRDALTQSGFRCPLTGIEGVSPDDLHPNYGLRKAAELFVKGVMEKVDEIEKQAQEQEDEDVDTGASAATAGAVEGDSGDKGVIVSRKTIGRSRRDEDDPFGGGDADFGGDVFDVQADESVEEQAEDATTDATDKEPPAVEEPSEPLTVNKNSEADKEDKQHVDDDKQSAEPEKVSKGDEQNDNSNKQIQNDNHVKKAEEVSAGKAPPKPSDKEGTPPQSDSAHIRREARRRGPPAGYASGPAGGAAVRGDHHTSMSSPYAGRGRGAAPFASPPSAGDGRGAFRGRGRGGRSGPRFGGERHSPEYDGRGDYNQSPRHEQVSSRSFEEDDGTRGTKRSRSESEDFAAEEQRQQPRGGSYPYAGRGDRRFDYPRGRGGPPPYRGRGAYGRRGGGRGGYRGGYYGGRGRY